MSALQQVSGGSPNAVVADVVFVHGIQGDPRGTWTNKNGGFWPSWVAEDNAGLAVWSAGYKAAVSEWAGTAMPLFDRANNVLAELQAAGIGSRPICWVAHSMGGLLVKKMLRNADSVAAEFKAFSNITRGVVFIGTPHSGSDLASLARYLGFILRPSAAAKDLKPLSEQLLELNLWYRENYRRLDVATQVYFETQTTKGVWVVDRGTADPGLEGVIPIGLDADHIGICKPSGKDDLIYKRTLAFIRSVVAPQKVNTDGRSQAPAHAAAAARTHRDPAEGCGRVGPAADGSSTPASQACPSSATGVSIVEVFDDTYHEEVIRQSGKRPVLIEAWAESCEPCRQLHPMLEQLARDAAGTWVLAKVNVDVNPKLRRSLDVHRIPMVVAMIRGQRVDGFRGVLSEAALRRWIGRVLETARRLGL